MKAPLALALIGSLALACGSVRSPAHLKGPAAKADVRVRIVAPRGVRLERTASEQDLCAAPCITSLPPRTELRAIVAERPDSPPFSVPDTSRGAIVKVSPAPRVLPGLGVITSTVGAASMLIGGAVVIGDVAGAPDLQGTATAGGITIAIGSAILAAGIVMSALSGTHVDVREATSLLTAPPGVTF